MVDSAVTIGLQPRRRVRLMKEYHPPLGDRSGLRLDFNENTLECSPAVLRVLGDISAAQLTKYPERESVEQTVADHMGLKAEQVLLTNGVDEAIHVLCETYLDSGDQMLLPVPTYTMYEVYASATDAEVIAIHAAADFRFPVERLMEAVTPQTRIIAIANPNSPTGSVATRADIVKIVELAPQAAVLVDEAYFHFFGETVADFIGIYPNLLLARTFSKAYGLAGLRLGMLAGEAETMRWLRRVISPYSVNSIALACLPAALQDDAYLTWYVTEVLGARRELAEFLGSRSIPCWPSQANFILANIGPLHASFTAALKQRGIQVRDRSNDPGCSGCVRITAGTRSQMSIGIEAIEQVLEEIGWTGSHWPQEGTRS